MSHRLEENSKETSSMKNKHDKILNFIRKWTVARGVVHSGNGDFDSFI